MESMRWHKRGRHWWRERERGNTRGTQDGDGYWLFQQHGDSTFFSFLFLSINVFPLLFQRIISIVWIYISPFPVFFRPVHCNDVTSISRSISCGMMSPYDIPLCFMPWSCHLDKCSSYDIPHDCHGEDRAHDDWSPIYKQLRVHVWQPVWDKVRKRFCWLWTK